jgi:hypothetical protein
MSQASLEISASLEPLPAQLQQALHTLNLEPEAEIEKYRLYKSTMETAESASAETGNDALRPAIHTTDEEEEEEYELIPPSQPFAVREPVLDLEPQPISGGALVPGELVLSSQLPADESLDLSYAVPGEISPKHNEYLPASQELWRSLGQPETAPAAEPTSKWRLPVAIGSTVIALASVGGMTYVNTHPALLQKVPLVAQLTAAPAPLQVPPGQILQGPDLSMGEFTELTLANINNITFPGKSEPAIAAPNNVAVAPSPAASAIAPTAATNTPPIANNPAPAATTTPAPAATPANSPTIADSLIRNLLPANIQQVNSRPAAAPQSATTKSESNAPATAQPYTPVNNMYFQPSAGANRGYQVFTEYQSPSLLAKIQAIVPKATLNGNKISLGTFKNKSEAEAIVKRLAQKGFIAKLQ